MVHRRKARQPHACATASLAKVRTPARRTDYSTKLLRAADAVIEKFWRNRMQERDPTQSDVTKWLTKEYAPNARTEPGGSPSPHYLMSGKMGVCPYYWFSPDCDNIAVRPTIVTRLSTTAVASYGRGYRFPSTRSRRLRSRVSKRTSRSCYCLQAARA
jgi:hypothetical protein